MAYKDEYEVARLHLDAVERAKLDGEFGEGAKVTFMLHPPLLRALGMKRKLKLGRWFVPAFRLLRALQAPARHAARPVRLPEVRRVERALIGEYRDARRRARSSASTPATHDTVARVAELPDVVRGYEDIKLRNVERFRADAARLASEDAPVLNVVRA